jgi:uncharacterized membrane protein YphA (DoxX/SURF4 family)
MTVQEKSNKRSGLSGTDIQSLQKKLLWILRISASLCFIGHGAFGIITKEAWLPYFALAGIGKDAAYTLMPLIGIMDISLGVLLLIRPFRFIMIWMTVWAVWTAMCRPLAGQGVWEFLERAGNYGVPFALLILSGIPKNLKQWVADFRLPPLTPDRIRDIAYTLRITTALLLIGHGGFGAFMHKSMLVEHFSSVGLPPFGLDPKTFLIMTGVFEIVLGLLVLIRPNKALLLLIVFWKVFTELLYPVSGDWFFEFIERFGSYGAPLALYVIVRSRRTTDPAVH